MSETEQTVRYIRDSYGVEPDYLWMKSPDCAAFRHHADRKWFAVLLPRLPRRKLGQAREGCVDILDVKCDPLLIPSLIQGKGILPGFHMNKAHWIALPLDGSVPMETVCALIDRSYALTRARAGKRRGAEAGRA